MIFLPFLLIIPFFWLLWSPERRDRFFDERKSPMDIARERYARGEITKEEYEQLKKDLS